MLKEVIYETWKDPQDGNFNSEEEEEEKIEPDF